MFSLTNQGEGKYHNLKFGILALAIVLVVSFVIIEPVWGVYHHASQAKKYITKAEEELKGGNFGDTNLYLSLAEKEFVGAKKSIGRLAWYKHIPWFSDQVIALEGLVSGALELTGSLNDLSGIATNILIPLEGGLEKIGQREKGEVLKALSESTPFLRETKDRLEKVSRELAGISEEGVLPQISQALGLVKEKLPLMQKTVEDLIIASRILPKFAGYPEEKTYLFLFQNNTELRPSGGFIGTYGILKIKNGEIVSFFTDDTYNLDKNFQGKVETPEPYQLYNKRYDWYFRDSNWSPDFPTSALKAEWFYHLEGGTEDLDGVIAITPTFIEKLLKLTGPIKVEDYPYEFTAQNFTDLLEFHVEKNFYKFESKVYRKNIVGKMGEVLLAHALTLPPRRFFDLFGVASEALTEKHLLIYFDDPNLQEASALANWDGRVREADGDYFLYIDCNLASLKSDPKVKRTIDYEVNWDGQGEPLAHLAMTYNHTGNFDWKTTRYRTYARVYVPQGSELVNISGNESEVKVYEELGKTVFAFFKVIEPQTSERVVLEYKLPARLTHPGYELYAQKQAGTVDHELNVKINWNGVQKEWKTDLAEDKEFRL